VEHRHLLPDEIDQLLDGEAGFGVAPLVAHVETCPECRAELAEARQVVNALERMPHFAPSPLFSERVMARVQVFEPWHVTALDTAKRWLPASRPTRALALGATLVFALIASVLAVWITVRLDAFLFFVGVAAQRARVAFFDAAGSAIAETFGSGALDALRAGGTTAAIGITGFLALVILAAVGLRALVATARRRRA
jgi:anti-sigma factor RsiW